MHVVSAHLNINRRRQSKVDDSINQAAGLKVSG
jgi:hypothetical protein